MRTNQLSKWAAAVACAAALAACNSTDGPGPQTAGKAPEQAPPAEQHPTAAEPPAPPADPSPVAAAPKPAAGLEGSPMAADAPFVVSLKGPDAAPDAGDVELTVSIEAPAEIKGPTTISVAVPKGAALTSGAASETLPALPAGKTTRTLKVHLSAKLADPIRVVVEAKDPGGAFGARSEQRWPDHAAAPARPTKGVPPPPVGRPGAPVKKP